MLLELEASSFHSSRGFDPEPPVSMRSLHFCSNWAKLCFWYALHLSFYFFSVFSVLVFQIRSKLRKKKMMMKKKTTTTKKKIPLHLALIIDSEDAKTHISSVVKVIEQIAHLGLHHVSLYDMEGLLKSVLVDALASHHAIRCYTHNEINCISPSHKNMHMARDCFGDGMAQLCVEILCLRDGKQAIVKAVQNLCLKSFQLGLVPDLREEDIDTSLREIGREGPDPDLLLLFSNTQCLSGFPPWRLKQTEIQYMGSIRNFSEKSLFRALDEFSQKEQRYGK